MSNFSQIGADEYAKRFLAKTPHIECTFKVGDRVTYVNDYGVKFHNNKIIGFSNPQYEGGGFIHLNKDSYWFPVRAENLIKDGA